MPFTKQSSVSSLLVHTLFALCTISGLSATVVIAQASPSTLPSQAESQKDPQPQDKNQEKEAELPAQIELLETKVRFEENGDSRKEVHTLVHINNELGARQFARLSFDYNRSFQQIELPLVRITHASGGTADILPSAISDQPNPAVINAPAYQDVRVKSIRILGLEPGDKLEYRVITTTTHHPLAPDFWLDHTFDRSGVVAHENFELDLPASRFAAEGDTLISDPLGIHAPFRSAIRIHVSPKTPVTSTERMGNGDSARVINRWLSGNGGFSEPISNVSESDIALTTFASWTHLALHVAPHLLSSGGLNVIQSKQRELIYGSSHAAEPAASIYEFVAKKITTIDLPLGSTGFQTRRPEDILSSGYGTPEDKFALFSALMRFTYISFHPLLICSSAAPETQLPRPSLFSHLLAETRAQSGRRRFLDLNVEVAPFGAVRADLRGEPALAGYQAPSSDLNWWTTIPVDLPYPSFQQVNVDATIAQDGKLRAKVRYAMRGDNELLLRVAFHRAPKEKWQEVAQLLALSDGFRGKVTSVTASDPYATKEPFTVEYEIAQPKFVDWSKKPVRIPAVLPLIGLPEAAPRSSGKNGAASSGKSESAPSAIELGTPLDVEASVTLRVPPDTGMRAPVGTSVQRDYASFASEYSARNLTLTAVRRIKFVRREIPAEQARDYAAFVRSVQNDQAQQFTLERGDSGQPTKTNPATRSATSAKVKP